MTGRSRLAALSGGLALVASMLLPVFSAPAAHARDMGTVTLAEGEIKELTYLPVPGNNPANQQRDPATCRGVVAGTGGQTDPVTNLVSVPYCDTVRLVVSPPKDPDLGYFVQIQMLWETRTEQEVPTQGEMTDNDMDLFVYKVPYDTAKKDDENMETSGATGAQPETAYTSGPIVDLTIVNFLGVNTGYKLKFTYVTDEEVHPFESLAEEFRPSEEFVAPAEEVVVPSVFSAPAALAGPIDISPGLGLVGVDDPFGLAAPVSEASGTRALELIKPEAAVAGPPRPVSTGTALLWLALVPGALFGSVAYFLMRRRRAFTLR
jgi:hypothetical protein